MSAGEIDNTVAMINLDSLAAGDVAYVYDHTRTEDSLRDLDIGDGERFRLQAGRKNGSGFG
jgi:hypothetical protein